MADDDILNELRENLQQMDALERRRQWLSEPQRQEYERISIDALWTISPRYSHFPAQDAIGLIVRIEGTSYLIAGLDQEAEQYLLVPVPSLFRNNSILEPEVAAERMNDFTARILGMFGLSGHRRDNSPSLSQGLTGREPMLSRKVAHDDRE